jgi:hypothetical protein
MSSRAAAKTSPAGRPKKSGRLRKLLLVLLVLILVGAGVLWYVKIAQYKRSDPYKAVVAAVAKNAEVTAALGEPVTDATIVPSVSSWNDTEAIFMLKVKGPKGEAQVNSNMRKLLGKWVSRTVTVELPNKKKIPIEVGDAGDDAPKHREGGTSGAGGAAVVGSGDGSKPESSPAKSTSPNTPGDEINIDVPGLPDSMPADEGKSTPAKK